MNHPTDRLHISEDGRRICHADGTVFFYLADTAWELFHQLNREEAEMYLTDRAAKGFTVIQASAVAEKDGMRRSNAYGRLPVKIGEDGAFDPLQPDTDGEYSYWDHVDWVVKRAGEMGLYIAMQPAWGDKFEGMRGEGPHVFTPENSFAYGKWLGERYRQAGNIIWVMGGDRVFTTRRQMEALDQMARGLKAGDGGQYLITMHPAGGQHSADCAHQEDWLDFNMIHSGHTYSRYNYEMIRRDYRRLAYKPVIDGECCHEGRPVDSGIENGYLDAADVRRCAYWSVFSGACGHVYGHHSVRNFVNLPDKDTKRGYFVTGWKKALNQAGSGQMKHLRALAESVPFEEGAPSDGLVSGNLPGMNHVAVLRGRQWLLAYSPNGVPFEMTIPGELDGAKAAWFNPRTGETQQAFSVKTHRVNEFVPPDAGRGSDWVLVLR